MYTEERIQEILNSFTEVLVKADNFPSGSNPKEYKQFLVALRKEGANLLGVSRYLYDQIAKEKPKKEVHKEDYSNDTFENEGGATF